MTNIFLQLFAIFEYLLSSLVPGIIICTLLSAVQDLITKSITVANLQPIVEPWQYLLLLLVVELAITGVSYKLNRPNDLFVFDMMRLVYLFVHWLQFAIVHRYAATFDGTLLKNIFIAKFLVGMAFLTLTVLVQCCKEECETEETETSLKDYRELMSRLHQFSDQSNVVYVSLQEDDDQEEDEDANEQKDLQNTDKNGSDNEESSSDDADNEE